MITINISKKIKYISKEFYKRVTDSLDPDSIICPKCKCTGLVRHGFYERSTDIFNRNDSKIMILRLMCPHCNSTHAILIEDMIPYSIASFHTIVDVILKNDTIDSSICNFLTKKFQPLTIDYQFFCILCCRNFPMLFLTITT